jgi:hypothetical protein
VTLIRVAVGGSEVAVGDAIFVGGIEVAVGCNVLVGGIEVAVADDVFVGGIEVAVADDVFVGVGVLIFAGTVECCAVTLGMTETTLTSLRVTVGRLGERVLVTELDKVPRINTPTQSIITAATLAKTHCLVLDGSAAGAVPPDQGILITAGLLFPASLFPVEVGEPV